MEILPPSYRPCGLNPLCNLYVPHIRLVGVGRDCSHNWFNCVHQLQRHWPRRQRIGWVSRTVGDVRAFEIATQHARGRSQLEVPCVLLCLLYFVCRTVFAVVRFDCVP